MQVSASRRSPRQYSIMRSPRGARHTGPAANSTLAGRVPSMSFLGIKRHFGGGSISIRFARQLEYEHTPSQLVGAAQPGDLFAKMTEVPDGVASACALALPEGSDEEFI